MHRRTRVVTCSVAAVLVVACLALNACAHMGAFVLVKNSTNKTVSQVVLYGRGDSETVKTLKPGATRLTRIAPTSESDLAVTFTVDGRRVQAHPDGYFGSSPLYIVTAEIRPDLTVRVNSGLVGSR